MVTWQEIKTEIENEYDLSEETFKSPVELLDNANEAIDEIESEIHKLNDKYFETEASMALTASVSAYARPTDMYANKITGIFYNNGSTQYEIKPLKDKRKIYDIKLSDLYQYRIVNSTADGIQIKLYPMSSETSTSNVTIHYIRQARHFVDGSSTLDIPEGKAFVKQYVVDQAANKERMTPDAPESAALNRKRKQLLEVLSSMIEDENNELMPDPGFYQTVEMGDC